MSSDNVCIGNLKDVNFRPSYNSDYCNILEEFYIPALRNSCKYQRMAGFFSSTSLAVAAKGIQGLIENGGKIELLCSGRLSAEDANAINTGCTSEGEILTQQIHKDILNISSNFVKDHVGALAWMLANKFLEIRIMFVTNKDGTVVANGDESVLGLFHPKVGILYDKNGDHISFSGSENESALGWTTHIEQFKVFKSWEKTQIDFLLPDKLDFERFWEGNGIRCKTFSITDAIKNELVSLAPDTRDSIALDRWIKNQNGSVSIPSRLKLSPIQNTARDNWLANGKKGIFEMATGTGKTYAALSCLELEMAKDQKMISVIAAPYDHLVKQWQREIERFGLDVNTIIADSSVRSWKEHVVNSMIDARLDRINRLVILTTHASLSSEIIINEVMKTRFKKLLIVDEVHGIGAPEYSKGLLDDYDYRIGLSATPRRWMDEDGTEKICNYFGDTVIKFGLKEAINTINPSTGKPYLVPYDYYPIFINLTDPEKNQYDLFSARIARALAKAKKDPSVLENVKLLLIQRRQILSDAIEKYHEFSKLLDKIEPISNCLVYCSPNQIDGVLKILDDKRIVAGKFTMEESTTSNDGFGGLSEREIIISNLENGTYKALVAMKCLDQGVDIRPAKIGILMCSSGNEIEFIQRRGRLLRPSPGKDNAIIYDFIPVFPRASICDNIESKDIHYLADQELKRIQEFASSARNHSECLKTLVDLQLGKQKMGV